MPVAAAGEQAALSQWQWGLAWLFTGLVEPPWMRIRFPPAPDAARPFSRLADQTLLAIAMAYYKEVQALPDAQRRWVPPPRSTTSPPEQQNHQRADEAAQPKAPRNRRRGGGKQPASPAQAE